MYGDVKPEQLKKSMTRKALESVGLKRPLALNPLEKALPPEIVDQRNTLVELAKSFKTSHAGAKMNELMVMSGQVGKFICFVNLQV
jgi:hypothetical protein